VYGAPDTQKSGLSAEVYYDTAIQSFVSYKSTEVLSESANKLTQYIWFRWLLRKPLLKAGKQSRRHFVQFVKYLMLALKHIVKTPS
jgi:hypothetical protein